MVLGPVWWEKEEEGEEKKKDREDTKARGTMPCRVITDSWWLKGSFGGGSLTALSDYSQTF